MSVRGAADGMVAGALAASASAYLLLAAACGIVRYAPEGGALTLLIGFVISLPVFLLMTAPVSRGLVGRRRPGWLILGLGGASMAGLYVLVSPVGLHAPFFIGLAFISGEIARHALGTTPPAAGPAGFPFACLLALLTGGAAGGLAFGAAGWSPTR